MAVLMSGQIKSKNDPREKIQKDVSMAEKVKTSKECSSFSPFCRAVNLHRHTLLLLLMALSSFSPLSSLLALLPHLCPDLFSVHPPA